MENNTVVNVVFVGYDLNYKLRTTFQLLQLGLEDTENLDDIDLGVALGAINKDDRSDLLKKVQTGQTFTVMVEEGVVAVGTAPMVEVKRSAKIALADTMLNEKE